MMIRTEFRLFAAIVINYGTRQIKVNIYLNYYFFMKLRIFFAGIMYTDTQSSVYAHTFSGKEIDNLIKNIIFDHLSIDQ